jgi:hypothetical protein
MLYTPGYYTIHIENTGILLDENLEPIIIEWNSNIHREIGER